MTDFVSIITPAYRAEATIVESVRSVLAQSHTNWEMLIVSDDGCDYKTLLLNNNICDKRLRFFASPRPQSGPNISRNVALQQAAGEWIAPLDADDIYYPERLNILLSIAGERGLALDNVNIVGEGLDRRLVFTDPYPDAFDFEEFKTSLVPLLFIFNKAHVKQGWDEDVERGADTLFNLRALESAGGAAFFPGALHEYRVHGASMCHAVGAERIFVNAYRHTLNRLKSDGLGFQQEGFRQQVIEMIEEKKIINEQFLDAVQEGFKGNYQSFVEAKKLC